MSLDGHLAADVTDDAVAFAFTVENAGTEPIDLEFRSGKTVDVAVYDDGVERWRWSDGRLFTQAVQTEVIDPGESIDRELTWTDLEPGTYTAVASLEAVDTTLVERLVFTVP